MPTYDIAGVPVDFPYDAYDVQLAYMEKVVLALARGQNALLESPTGTGKTLSLLCSALGWRRAQVERARAGAGAAAPSDAPAADDLGTALRASLGQGQEPVYGRLPRIIYASRTHSQLQQVVRELRRTVHRPTVCVLGSREQLCVHPHVKTLQGAAQGGACQALTAAQGCGFHTKLQLLKRKHGGVLEHPEKAKPDEQRALPDIEDFVDLSQRQELCPFYYARELQRTAEMLFVPYNYLIDPNARRALNIELARARAPAALHSRTPPRALRAWAPAPHAGATRARRVCVSQADDILIFDEAHNMERACTDAASFDLSSAQLVGCIKEVDRCIQGAQNSAVDEVEDEAKPEAGEWLGMKQARRARVVPRALPCSRVFAPRSRRLALPRPAPPCPASAAAWAWSGVADAAGVRGGDPGSRGEAVCAERREAVHERRRGTACAARGGGRDERQPGGRRGALRQGRQALGRDGAPRRGRRAHVPPRALGRGAAPRLRRGAAPGGVPALRAGGRALLAPLPASPRARSSRAARATPSRNPPRAHRKPAANAPLSPLPARSACARGRSCRTARPRLRSSARGPRPTSRSRGSWGTGASRRAWRCAACSSRACAACCSPRARSRRWAASPSSWASPLTSASRTHTSSCRRSSW